MPFFCDLGAKASQPTLGPTTYPTSSPTTTNPTRYPTKRPTRSYISESSGATTSCVSLGATMAVLVALL